MMASKAKRLVKGSVLGGISFILRIFISLFMTPFMIMSLGDQTYGLWMLVASLSGFYGVLDLGLSSAVQRYMSRSIGAEDYEDVNSVFNTSLVVFTGIGVLAMLAAGGIAWLAPVFVKSAEHVALFRIVVLIASVNIVIGFPMRSFWGVFSSNLRYDISVWLEMANVIVKAILIIGFLKYGFGIITIALINLVADVAWHIANIIFAKKIAPYIQFSFRYFHFHKIKQFLGYSIYVFIAQIANLLKFYIDNYVISTFIGLGAVTVYSIGFRLILYANQFLNKSVGLVTPVFSQYDGQGDFESIKEKFFFLLKITTYVAVFLGYILTVLSRPFIKRWVGLGYDESSTVIFILVIPFVFKMMMYVSTQLLYGISKHKFLTWINSGEAIFNLGLSLIFVQFWGIKGVALGTAIPLFIVCAFIQPIYTARVLGVSILEFYLKMFYLLSKSSLILIVIYVLTQSIISASYTLIAVFGVVQIIFYAALVFLFGLSKSEKQLVLSGSFLGHKNKKDNRNC